MARRDKRRETSTALAVSAVLHLGLLAVLAHVAAPILREPVYAPQPPVQVELTTPFRLQPAPSAAPRASRRPVPRASSATLRPRFTSRPAPARPVATPPTRAIQAIRRAPPKAPVAAPAPPSTASASLPAAGMRPGAATGAGGPSGSGTQSEPGEDNAGGVRAFLRATVGCSHEDYARLNAAERAACSERIAREARGAGSQRVDTVPANKRAYYDAVQQAYQSIHDPRTPVSTGVGGSTYTGQGGHVPAIGLRCMFGGNGGTKCKVKVVPPQGVGTEEAGIPKP